MRHVKGSQKGCKACTRHLQRVQGSIRQPKGVQGMYKVAKRGVEHLQGIYKGCEATTREPKGVQGMYKASTKGARIY